MIEKKCMICDESSDDLTWVTLTKDEGKIIPATINGVQYDRVLMCPDCMLTLFDGFGVDRHGQTHQAEKEESAVWEKNPDIDWWKLLREMRNKNDCAQEVKE